QIDLPGGKQSGLVTVPEVLMNLGDIAFVNFDSRDVVRHKLVQRIVAAYKESDERAADERRRRAGGAPERHGERGDSQVPRDRR
ncbi:MAG: PhoH family protein, partial [Thermoleophilia bacterium]